MKTISHNVYTYNELSEKAKEKARDWWREGGLDDGWWDFVYDDAKEIFKFLGFDIEKIYFSGFWSQGDGACFEGSWKAKDVKTLAALKKYAPKDKELERMWREARKLKQSDPDLSFTVKHRGHYYHEYETDFTFYDGTEQHDDACKELARDAMRWIYKRLEAEYDYLMSDEAIAETLDANEYEFYENGTRVRCA